MDLQTAVSETLGHLQQNDGHMGELDTQITGVRTSSQAMQDRINGTVQRVMPQADSLLQRIKTVKDEVSSTSDTLLHSLDACRTGVEGLSTKLDTDFTGVFTDLEALKTKIAGLKEKLDAAHRTADDAVKHSTDESEHILKAFLQPLQHAQNFLHQDFAKQVQADTEHIQTQQKNTNQYVHDRIGKLTTRMSTLEKSLKSVATDLESHHTSLGKAVGQVADDALGQLKRNQEKICSQPIQDIEDTKNKVQTLVSDLQMLSQTVHTVISGLQTTGDASNIGLNSLCGCLTELRTTLSRFGISV